MAMVPVAECEVAVLKNPITGKKFQTAIVKEQAEQKRQEALGIRDAQNIIGESLTPANLSYYCMQTLQEVGQAAGNVIIAPTEGGNLLFDVPTSGKKGGGQ